MADNELPGMPPRQVVVTYSFKLAKVSEFRDAGDVPALDAATNIAPGVQGTVTKVTHTLKDSVDHYDVLVVEDE